jgi:hypothetical protein
MSLVLQSSGGGSVTLNEPTTASDFTQTLPAADGTVALLDGSNNLSVAGNLSFNSGYGSSAVAYGCRAWVNFNGTGTVAIRASGNVSSITDSGTGDYRVNFTTAMPDANYSIVASSINAGVAYALASSSTQTASQGGVATFLNSAPNTTADVNTILVAVFR